MTQQEILNRPFDLKTHLENFINYLEVIISPNGVIEYAVPSHQEALISKYMTKKGIKDRKVVPNMIPMNYAFDVMDYLCDTTGYIAVWTDGRVIGVPNRVQFKVLDRLVKANAMLPYDLREIENSKRNLKILKMHQENKMILRI